MHFLRNSLIYNDMKWKENPKSKICENNIIYYIVRERITCNKYPIYKLPDPSQAGATSVPTYEPESCLSGRHQWPNLQT
jgi:hypothetical protein